MSNLVDRVKKEEILIEEHSPCEMVDATELMSTVKMEEVKLQQDMDLSNPPMDIIIGNTSDIPLTDDIMLDRLKTEKSGESNFLTNSVVKEEINDMKLGMNSVETYPQQLTEGLDIKDETDASSGVPLECAANTTTEPGFFNCNDCEYTTRYKSELIDHMTRLHPNSGAFVEDHHSSVESIVPCQIQDISNQSDTPDLSSPNWDVVDYILNNSFRAIQHVMKLTIKQNGRPTPSMPSLVMTGKNQNRGFNINNYEKIKWLTASSTRNKLYCWNCVLFSNDESSVWGKTGYNNLQNLSRAVDRHEKSQEHISSSIKFELFGRQNMDNVLDKPRRRDIEIFNEKVRENREILKRLIDAVVYLSGSVDEGNFKELTDFLRTYDQKLERFLSEAGVSIQNDLIDSISSVVRCKIEEELRSAAFFSWQIDETTDTAGKSQLSVIVRYVIGGDIVERFVGFYDISCGKNAESLYQLLVTEFQDFDLKNKLIAQTYDGAAVKSGDFNGLQSKIKRIAPRALFTHSYAHKVNLSLSKACHGIKEVRIFFQICLGFLRFLQILVNGRKF